MLSVTLDIPDAKLRKVIEALEAADIDHVGGESNADYVKRGLAKHLMALDRRKRATEAASAIVIDPDLIA